MFAHPKTANESGHIARLKVKESGHTARLKGKNQVTLQD